ncbi:cupredoxin domain-containing protein [Candidatus Woesearchaeota archaeon]|nr:cupredoxin domain-containing protein [Candidatus Woesearchaeota archaeon]
MKNTTILLIIVAIIISVGAFVFVNGNGKGNPDGAKEDDIIQEITLSMRNYNYYPNTITVKKGIPVRIRLDSSITGCYRSFTIRDFGVSKNLRTPEDYVEFVPDKKGTFRFACAMGMGTGTIIVE